MSYHQIIYDRLREHGFTEAGALGVIGNWECESNCEPYRVQGDFSSYRSISRAYVNAINYGQLSRDSFARDQKGFGLAQWTYFSRKEQLFDAWKSEGGSIADIELQIAFAYTELKVDFPKDFELLCTTNDIYAATKAVCDRFENPAVKNYDARFQAAVRIKNEINLNSWSTSSPEPVNDQVEPSNDIVDHRLELRTIDRCCENFREVNLLMSLLECRNYEFDDLDSMWEALTQFQRENGLVPDSIVGPLTWSKLLVR